MSNFAKYIGGMIGLVLVLVVAIAIPPAHAHHDGIFSIVPDAGYKWEDPKSHFNRSLLWNPGATHPDHPHITASADEGKWNPDPGYSFNSSDSLDVSWRPGATHPNYPHITASTDEGKWTPDDGYVFTSPDDPNVLDVRWTPGKPSVEHSLVKASAQEGNWVPYPGYNWVNRDASWDVVWTPDIQNSEVDHVKAGLHEGTWYADSGYHLAKREDGRMYAALDETYTPLATGNTSTFSSPSTSGTSSSSSRPNYVGAIIHKAISNDAAKCANNEDHWLVTRMLCSAVSKDQEEKAESDWNGHH